MTNGLDWTNITSVMIKGKKETIENIKQAALEEFYDNGYAKASLRTICKRAGALFRAILEPLVESYERMLARFMQMEMEHVTEGPDIDILLMRFILEHKKETIIIMDKAQGSCYASYRKKIEAMMEQLFFEYFQSRLQEPPDKGLMKILARQRLDSCLEIVKEDYDMEYSLYLVKQTGIYAEGGTDRLIQSLRELHRN